MYKASLHNVHIVYINELNTMHIAQCIHTLITISYAEFQVENSKIGSRTFNSFFLSRKIVVGSTGADDLF